MVEVFMPPIRERVNKRMAKIHDVTIMTESEG